MPNRSSRSVHEQAVCIAECFTRKIGVPGLSSPAQLSAFAFESIRNQISIRRLPTTQRALTDLTSAESPLQVLCPGCPPLFCVYRFGWVSSDYIGLCVAIGWRKHKSTHFGRLMPPCISRFNFLACGPQTFRGAVESLDECGAVTTAIRSRAADVLSNRSRRSHTPAQAVRTLLPRSCRKLGYFYPRRNRLVHY